MAINQLDFATLVANQITAIQGVCNKILDFAIGAIMRSLIESNAALGIWLQQLILNVLATTRAGTSSGSDLDSWMADFGLTRLPAIAATGTVTFSRFTPTLQATIPVGTQLVSSDGSETFTVTSAGAGYNATVGGYVLAAGQASMDVAVAAVTPGSGGNVAAGALNTLVSPIAGVDTVSNALSFGNGEDAESDDAFRSRFQAFIAGLSKATKTAIGYAVASVQSGVIYSIVENQDYNGAIDNGYFYVVADDGSGNPPQSFLTNVANAVDAVRPIGSRFGVFGPTMETATITLTLAAAAGYTHDSVANTVQAALQAYINGLQLGQSLSYTRLLQVAYDASAGVANITGYTINGGTTDLTASAQQVIRAGTITIN